MIMMMNRIKKTILIAAGLLAVACYNDFETPAPAQPATAADFEAEGLTYVSIRDLKKHFLELNPGYTTNMGAAYQWTVTEPWFTCGKVISSDRTGNSYRSLYIYDAESEAAIELKVSTGNYLFHPVGQMVYVKLQGLVLGNYRGMISVGTTSTDSSYANANIVGDVMLAEHIFTGEQVPMEKADTLVITKDNYATMKTEALGRLVRIEGVTSTFGTSNWGYKNTFPNYFANSTSYDVSSPGWEDIESWATWATTRILPGEVSETSFYGSAWFTYDPTLTTSEGNYVVRSSGYSSFRDNPIPKNGTVVDITAIYTVFTSPSGGNAAYQLVLNTDTDVVER